VLNFELSDELKMIRESISKYCNKHIKPAAASLDQAHESQEDAFRRIFDGRDE